ncbi:hypothetical protein [Streptomyces daghestanicus]|uniref:hypothetical protein n=1 Tax=Streptomyces daghestanicus TaxID=66885 RepID=UPI001CFA6B1D|nr:hypothetical protein [Streptomyces daghestanicus]
MAGQQGATARHAHEGGEVRAGRRRTEQGDPEQDAPAAQHAEPARCPDHLVADDEVRAEQHLGGRGVQDDGPGRRGGDRGADAHRARADGEPQAAAPVGVRGDRPRAAPAAHPADARPTAPAVAQATVFVTAAGRAGFRQRLPGDGELPGAVRPVQGDGGLSAGQPPGGETGDGRRRLHRDGRSGQGASVPYGDGGDHGARAPARPYRRAGRCGLVQPGRQPGHAQGGAGGRHGAGPLHQPDLGVRGPGPGEPQRVALRAGGERADRLGPGADGVGEEAAR